MSKLDQITADAGKTAPRAAKPRAKTMLVLDTTAAPGQPPRQHEQIVDGMVKTYEFKAGIASELPVEVAVKFLKHDAFRLVDEQGTVVPYQRRPKQPDELGAGEKLKLADNETVARYDELSNAALLQRALELPGGERFGAMSDAPKRGDLIAFIQETITARRKANASSDRDAGGYTPKPEQEPDFEDEDAADAA